MVFKEVETVRFNRVIFDWEKPVDKMYVIVNGSVTLIRKRKIPKSDSDYALRLLSDSKVEDLSED